MNSSFTDAIRDVRQKDPFKNNHSFAKTMVFSHRTSYLPVVGASERSVVVTLVTVNSDFEFSLYYV